MENDDARVLVDAAQVQHVLLDREADSCRKSGNIGAVDEEIVVGTPREVEENQRLENLLHDRRETCETNGRPNIGTIGWLTM